MSSATERIRLSVEQLRMGMYVAECDRPWKEVPLMFQGFVLRDEDELRVLRDHCHFVYVDIARSDDGVVGELADGGGPSSETEPAEGVSRPSGNFANQRYPSVDDFQSQVDAVGEARIEALEFVGQALEDTRLGRGLSSVSARAVVPSLTRRVANNPAAALWLTTLRARDQYTEIHSINVCVLSLAFALHIGIKDRKLLEAMALGALLHDIGKVEIPPDILDRPGPLSEEEWALVKQHPEAGYRIAADSGDVPREALNIILLHHERRDGQGYPMGLSGGQVPEYVQIVALANAYESLTSARPYRPAAQPDAVLQNLYNDADNLFGRDAVERFIRCVGIYPVGSLVELDNDAIGVVVDSPPDDRLRPTVLMVRTPDGQPYEKRLLLNLSIDAKDGVAAPARAVRRVLNPEEEEIDVAAIVAFEFGFDLGPR